MSRSGIGILRNREGHLSAGTREARAADKRRELRARGLTPDWFTSQGGTVLCLPRMKVAIVGAGFAGLAAAWYLEACGVATTVYEASDHVGGRVGTDRSFVRGGLVEAGAELIGENHPLWWILADEFRLRLQEITQDDEYERRVPPLNVRTRFSGHDLTPAEKAALELDLEGHFADIGRDAFRIHPRLPWRSPGAGTFDGMSVGDKIDQMIGPVSSTVRDWLEFTLANDNCAAVGDQSYLGLLTLVSAGRMGNDPAGMLGYWESTETHRCADGNQALATRIAASLPDVRLSSPVRRIEIGRGWLFDNVRILREGEPDGFLDGERYDFVILATPPTVWSGISFDPPFDIAARTIQQGDAVKFLSRYDTRFWEAAGLAPSMKWDELGSVWEGTDRQSPEQFDLSVFSGGPHVLAGSAYPGKLASAYPTGTPTGARFVDWPHTPRIMTGYSVPAVGEVTTVARRLQRPHAGRLFFAGEQASPGFFGYMEGALQSGARAARDLAFRTVRPCALEPFLA